MSRQTDQAEGSSADAPRVRASARGVPMAPRKVRRVVNLVRGKAVGEALAILAFDPHAASRPVSKVIASAAANATNNHGLDPGTLRISRIYVDEARKFRRRLSMRAQGRASLIKKRDSHITVEVESVPQQRAAGRTARRGPRKSTGERTSTKATQTRSAR